MPQKQPLTLFLCTVVLCAFPWLYKPGTAQSPKNSTHPTKANAANALPKATSAKAASTKAASAKAASAKTSSRVSTTSPKVKRTIRPLAQVMLSHPHLTIKRLYRRYQQIDPASARVMSARATLFLSAVIPGLTPETLLNAIPGPIYKAVGIDLSQSIAVSQWQYRHHIVAMGTLALRIDILRNVLQQWLPQLRIETRPISGSYQQVFAIMGRKLQPIGVYAHHKLYMVLPVTPFGRVQSNKTLAFLLELLKQYPDPTRAAQKALFGKKIALAIQQQDADLVGSINAQGLQQNIPLPSDTYPFFSAQNIRDLGAIISFKEGVKLRLLSGLGKHIQRWFDAFRTTQPPVSWVQYIPASAGWLGATYSDPLAMPKFFDTILKQKNLPPQFFKETREFFGIWKKVEKNASEIGIDLKAMLASSTGFFSSGYLWDKSVFQRLLKPTGSQAHSPLKGIFLMLEWRSPSDAERALGALPKIFQYTKSKLSPDLMGPFRSVTLAPVKIAQKAAMALTIPSLEPMYLVAIGKYILIAGHKDTLDAFLQVADNKAPSLATTLRKQPETNRFLRKHSQSFVLFPRPLRDVNAWLSPALYHTYLTPLFERLHLTTSHSDFSSPHQYESTLQFQLTSQPHISPQRRTALKKQRQQMQSYLQQKYMMDELKALGLLPTTKPSATTRSSATTKPITPFKLHLFHASMFSFSTAPILAATTIPSFFLALHQLSSQAQTRTPPQ